MIWPVRGLRRAWRRLLGGGSGELGVRLLGPADVGPGRDAGPEEWERYRRELLDPPPRPPSTPPPGYRFVWYTDSSGMRRRAAVRDTGPQPPAGP